MFSPSPQLWRMLALAGCAALASAAQAQKLSMPLNDTGMTQCVVNNQFTTACAGTGQDGEFGRDVTANRPKNGAAGFAYQKICNSGEVAGTGACPSKPKLGGGTNEWGCTQDMVTRLIWEVKTTDGGLRDWGKQYTNLGDGRTGDASEFVAQVNAQGLCGATDWVLPTVQQLLGLVNDGVPDPGPTLDTKWFPNTLRARYWTKDIAAGLVSYAWVVNFSNGNVSRYNRHNGYAVRLVRAGQ